MRTGMTVMNIMMIMQIKPILIQYTLSKEKAKDVKENSVSDVDTEKVKLLANASGGFVGAEVFVVGVEEDSCFALGGDDSLLGKDLVKEKAKVKVLLCLKVKE